MGQGSIGGPEGLVELGEQEGLAYGLLAGVVGKLPQ